MNMPSQSKHTALLVFMFSIIMLTGGLYIAWSMYYGDTDEKPPQAIGDTACTLEAKLCPDGTTYVGRSGPECAFAVCPDSVKDFPEKETLLLFKFDTDTGLSFMYPADFGSLYITPVDWPPTLTIGQALVPCLERSEPTELRNVNGKTYCITREEEGAAGSVYTRYTYEFEYGGGPLELKFSFREVQCTNYDEPQQSTCITEQNLFNADIIFENIVESIS